MVDSEYRDRFVVFNDGMVVPAPAYLLLLDLERRSFTVTREGDAIFVRPPEKLTRTDCALLRHWKRHLLMLLTYCETRHSR
jgi:hypothetical protein